MNKTGFISIIFLMLFSLSALIFGQSVEADSLINLAKSLIYDEPDKAESIAWDIINQNAKNPDIQVEALLVISTAKSSIRDYEKSMEYAMEAEQISSKSKNERIRLLSASQIANLYHQLSINDKALEYLDKADELAENVSASETISRILGNNNAIRGFIYRDQLNCDLAIKYFDKAYENYSFGEKDKNKINNKSIVSYNRGNCFIKMDKPDSAWSNFKKASELAQKTDAKSLDGFAHKGLAEVLTLEGRHEEALKILNAADSISGNVGDLILNRGIFKVYADNYSALEDWDNFHFYNEKLESVSREIKTSERKTIQNLIDNYNRKIQKEGRNFSTRFGISIFILSMLFLVLLFNLISKEISFQKEIRDIKSKIKL